MIDEKTGEVVQQTRWHLEDYEGKPGKIITALLATLSAVGAVTKGAGDKGTTAQDVFEVVRPQLIANNIFPLIRVANAELSSRSPYAMVSITIRFIHADGSWCESYGPGGASAQNAKYVQAAITAGLKSIYRHQFMVPVDESGKKREPALSKSLNEHRQYLWTLTTVDELRNAGQHETALKLKRADHGAGQDFWRQRMEQLVALDGAGWRAREVKSKLEAESNASDKEAREQAKRVRRNGPAKPDVDLSKGRPMRPEDKK